MPKAALPTELPSERALLVGIEVYGRKSLLGLEASLSELAQLADTAGLQVIGEIHQKISKPDPNTYIGSGKADELRALAEETLADVVVFDDELSPRHQRELEQKLGENVKVLDRTALILDIFAQHARTREGALQVELAQYEYRLPRLTRQWTHLARQAGGAAGRGGTGGVGLRGPGETQLEADRREITERIVHLKKELEKVRAHRKRYRLQRQRNAVPIVAIVGYTNAGKSTLLNTLTGSQEVVTADQLFATLDPTTRRVRLPNGKTALFTDTVGFIQKLPTTLVAAFRATLEEIGEADLLLHVLDVTHPNARQQAQAVAVTLDDLNVHDVPVLLVLNKVDALTTDLEAEARLNLGERFEMGVPISALTGQGVEALLERVSAELYSNLVPLKIKVPYKNGQLISLFHEQAVVDHVEHCEDGVELEGRIPERLAPRFRPFVPRARRAAATRAAPPPRR
ncbi:MAG: GTPase HflX [Anaerolineales bacterium]|nr:GTPase HflX [Anaerolineales bacterium]